MTQDNLAAARNAGKRATLLMGMILSLALAACGGGASQSTAELNQPLNQTKAAPVAFGSIIGAPPAIGPKMTEALAAAAKEKGVPVVDAPNAEFMIVGNTRAFFDASGTVLTYKADIADKAGKRVRSIEVQENASPKKSGDAWKQVDDAALARMSGKLAVQLHAFLTGAPAPQSVPLTAAAPPAAGQRQPVSSTASLTPAPQAQPSGRATGAAQTPAQAAAPPTAPIRTAAAPVPPGEVRVYVRPVANAPGDGQTSLTAAMRKHLANQGVKVTEARIPNAYTIQGVVEMGAAENGEQPIKISWQVIDPAGKPLTNVVQRNKVDQDSLNGAWGPVADAAAQAASAEVANVMPKPST